jgi:UDP-glucose 4-epimerase
LECGSAGIYNLAGDGALSLREIAKILHKPYLPLPAGLIQFVLKQLKPLGLSQYGPEQVDFLRYRPVLANRRLKEEFGYTPRFTSREAFIAFLDAQGLAHA